MYGGDRPPGNGGGSHAGSKGKGGGGDLSSEYRRSITGGGRRGGVKRTSGKFSGIGRPSSSGGGGMGRKGGGGRIKNPSLQTALIQCEQLYWTSYEAAALKQVQIAVASCHSYPQLRFCQTKHK